MFASEWGTQSPDARVKGTHRISERAAATGPDRRQLTRLRKNLDGGNDPRYPSPSHPTILPSSTPSSPAPSPAASRAPPPATMGNGAKAATKRARANDKAPKEAKSQLKSVSYPPLRFYLPALRLTTRAVERCGEDVQVQGVLPGLSEHDPT